jgi:hypothetical protein
VWVVVLLALEAQPMDLVVAVHVEVGGIGRVVR